MTIFASILQGILALMFIIAGSGKIFGAKMHIENFKQWGYPQWFRVVTGLIELVGTILLIVGYWYGTAILIGAAIFFVVGIGGVITHIRVKDTLKDIAMILVLGILALVLLIILLL